MRDEQTRKYFFLFVLLGAGVLVAVLLWPFVTVIALSAALSVVFWPVYRFIHTRLFQKKLSWLAALLTVVVFVALLCVPIFFIGLTVLEQSKNIYGWVVEQGNVNALMTKLNMWLNSALSGEAVSIEDRVAEITSRFTESIGAVFAATISTIFSLFLVILSMFYFLKDGSKWRTTILRMSPLSEGSNQRVLDRLRSAVRGVVAGYLLIALVQGTLMGVGLWLFGVPNAALWGVFAGIASLVPTVGTALVSIPAIIYLFSIGSSGAAFGFMVWAATLVGSIDNLLNPIVVGAKIDIHPLLVLFAVLGGLALLGPVGILIGPLIISFAYALVGVYRSEMNA